MCSSYNILFPIMGFNAYSVALTIWLKTPMSHKIINKLGKRNAFLLHKIYFLTLFFLWNTGDFYLFGPLKTIKIKLSKKKEYYYYSSFTNPNCCKSYCKHCFVIKSHKPQRFFLGNSTCKNWWLDLRRQTVKIVKSFALNDFWWTRGSICFVLLYHLYTINVWVYLFLCRTNVIRVCSMIKGAMYFNLNFT